MNMCFLKSCFLEFMYISYKWGTEIFYEILLMFLQCGISCVFTILTINKCDKVNKVIQKYNGNFHNLAVFTTYSFYLQDYMTSLIALLEWLKNHKMFPWYTGLFLSLHVESEGDLTVHYNSASQSFLQSTPNTSRKRIGPPKEIGWGVTTTRTKFGGLIACL